MNPDIKSKYPIGSRPNISYLPYLIFISYIVSLIGAFTTVELLHRRVCGSGWRSLLQLCACSVSFGLVAIWCMHFVGNRAIILGDGEDEIQLYYSSTYTAVSAILPIIVIFLGLLVADRFFKGNKRSTIRYFALAVCGICCGAAVTEMHYLGNNGTTNYRLEPRWPYIVGAATIAIGACLVAFSLFFHWSGHWINNFWRRFIVACFLAVAVSGMHWTAAAGTTYELLGYHQGPGQARNINLIIAVCLCLSACGVCFAIGFLKQRHERKLKDRAQQVVLAIATFDQEGRLLVTQGGLLPCQTITRQFQQRTFDEDFNISHPVFQWIFRVSHHWSGIVDLIPAMRDHLQSTGWLQIHSPMMGGASSDILSGEDNSSYATTFRELFCVTAHDIAKSLEMRLQDLGCLYEDVLTTGTLLNRALWKDIYGKTIIAADVATLRRDLEVGANPILFGKGQLLVLTRKVGTEEGNRLQNMGYRFASIDQIGDHLARSLQISRDDLNNLVERLQVFCDRDPSVPIRGTYLAAFLLQPSPVVKGLDVIVPKMTPDRLPMIKFTRAELDHRYLKVLSLFNGLSLEDCLARIAQRSGTNTEIDFFLDEFRNGIYDLIKQVPEPALRRAIFSSQQLDIAHGMRSQNEPSHATVFAFCGIKEIYSQSLQSQALRTVPLSFFQTYLRSYPGCPDHAILAQKNHKEFSTLLSPSTEEPASENRPGSKWPGLLRLNRLGSASSETSLNLDSSSEKGLVNAMPMPAVSSNNVGHPFGGIMISQDIVINEDHNHNNNGHLEMSDLGVRSIAGVADMEQQTMADRLMSITMAFRDPYATRVLIKDHSSRR